MSSRSVLDGLFPTVMIDMIYPTDLDIRYPRPAIPLTDDLTLYRPLTFVACIFGCATSLYMALTLLSSAAKVRGHFTWGMALLLFATMNFETIFLHCFADYPRNSHGEWLLHGDCWLTGCSSFSILLAALTDCGVLDDRTPNIQSVLWVGYVAMFALCAQLVGPLSALIYVGVTLLAAITASWVLIITPFFRRNGHLLPGTGWLVVALLCASSYISIFIDPLLQSIFGPHGAFTTWVFWGCDVGFICIYQYVQATQSSRLKGLYPTAVLKQKAT